MPDLFRSAEIRWFFPGTPDAAVDAWVRQGGLAKDMPERTDRYLVLPGCTTVGIKIREGRFEIKARTGSREAASYGPDVSGYRDSWVKWSRVVDGMDHLADQASDEERWAYVRKRRTLRLLSLEGGVPEDAEPGKWLQGGGCQVERSKLAVIVRSAQDEPPTDRDWQSATRWWSVSLEAFGEPGSELSNLDTAAAYVFRDGPPVALAEQASMAYPRWLNGLRDSGNLCA